MGGAVFSSFESLDASLCIMPVSSYACLRPLGHYVSFGRSALV